MQAYALQTILEHMGHEVTIINRPYIRQVNLLKHPGELLRRIKSKYIEKRNIRIFREKYEAFSLPIIESNTRKFVDGHIHTITVNDPSELERNLFDTIIVGSDQIWRAAILGNRKNRYNSFLEFAKEWNIKRIAYAPSFGTENWEYRKEETIHCAQLIQIFDAISVREDSGVRLCKEHFNVKATHVLDPTLLLNKEDYMEVLEKASLSKLPGNMMVYILDETPAKMALMNRFAKDLGLSPFKVNSKADDINATIDERIQPPIENWLQGFRDSEFIVTDSFHACVFSIIFGKPFIVIGNKNRGMARFESLLKMFGLDDRLIGADYTGGLPTSSIQKAKEMLEQKRRFSKDWLKYSLENKKEF